MGNRTARNTGVPGTGFEAVGDEGKMSDIGKTVQKVLDVANSSHNMPVPCMPSLLIKICQSWQEQQRELEELDFLRYEGGEESIGREIERAEARGYRRGVEDAAKHLEAEADFEVAEASAMLIWAAAKLRKLADAEQTGDSKRPHPENGTGLKSET
jgi:hypothetical protein